MEPNPPTDIEPLLVRISERKEKIHIPFWVATMTVIFFTVMYLGLFTLIVSVFPADFPFLKLLFWSGFIVPAHLSSSLFFDKTRKRNIERVNQEISQLAHYDDVRAVPVLLDEFSNKDSEVRLAVRAGLLRLLPKLQATDAPLLNAKQREILYALPFTKEFHHEAFRLAALSAIGQIGDRRALHLMRKNGPALQNYAHVKKQYPDVGATHVETMLPNPRYPLLKAAVEDCIAAIEARLAAEHSGATLLRGSQVPADAPETLLRPVAAADATDPRQLLRPAPPSPDADA